MREAWRHSGALLVRIPVASSQLPAALGNRGLATGFLYHFSVHELAKRLLKTVRKQELIKPGDLVVNATEPKKLTNHRASGSDDASRIAPKTLMTLEECMEYIQQDECIEVTPKIIRMRKVILDEDERKKVQKRMSAEQV